MSILNRCRRKMEGCEEINNNRRKQIRNVVRRIDRIQTTIDCLQEYLQMISDEEKNYRDDIPENLRDSGIYEEADHACAELKTAYEHLGDSKENLFSVVCALESAIR